MTIHKSADVNDVSHFLGSLSTSVHFAAEQLNEMGKLDVFCHKEISS